MRLVIVVCFSLACFGCTTAPVPSYQVNKEYAALRGLDKKVRVVAQAPAFKDDGSITCRGAAIVELPNKQNFTDYISSALVKELTAADIASETADLVLYMRLEKVDFSTSLGATKWLIDGHYEIGGKTIQISTVYNDRSSYFGTKACDNIAAYFQKAVSTHFRQLFNEPALKQELKVSN